MAKAIWKNNVIAESYTYEIIDRNIFFPPNKVNKKFLRHNDYHTTCIYKGRASYYDVVINKAVNKNAALYYPHPKKGFEKITNYIAFRHGIEVIQ